MKVRLLHALLLLSIVYPAQAELQLKYFAFLKGECSNARIDNFDHTVSCNNKLLARHSAYLNDFLSFGFTSAQFNVSFAGQQLTKKNNEESELIITKITTGQGKTINTAQAKGLCRIQGGMARMKTIHCQAIDLSSRIKYQLTFQSSATPEYLFTFGHEPFDAEANIRAAVRRFDTIYKKSGIEGTQKFLEKCYPDATKLKRLSTLLMCLSIDTVAALLDKNNSRKNKQPQQSYFTDSAYDQRLRENFEQLGSDKDMKLKMRSVIMVTQRRAIKELKKLNKNTTAQTDKPHAAAEAKK